MLEYFKYIKQPYIFLVSCVFFQSFQHDRVCLKHFLFPPYVLWVASSPTLCYLEEEKKVKELIYTRLEWVSECNTLEEVRVGSQLKSNDRELGKKESFSGKTYKSYTQEEDVIMSTVSLLHMNL